MRFSTLNPFRSLPNPREVWAWGMYDLANQSFQLLINTLLFSIYLRTYVAPEVIPGTHTTRGESAWGLMSGASLLLVVVASPILGAIADARALRREFLLATGLGAVALTAALALVGPGMLPLAAAIYIAAAFLVGIGENFLGSFLPQLATPQTMGRVSAIGWTMSYVGALTILGLTAIVLFVLDATDPRQWRWIFVGAAVWFLLGMLPTIFFLRETLPAAAAPHSGSLIALGLRQLRGTVREASRYRQLIRFFGVFFVYSMGTLAVIMFAGLIGNRLGFGLPQLTLLAIVMSITAGAGAVLAARYQDRLGHRRTIRLYLAVWVLSTLALAYMESRSPAIVGGETPAAPAAFWLISAGLGLGLGGIGTASRATVGVFTPAHKSAEFFGLWGMIYRLGGVAGVVAFGQVSRHVGSTAGLLLLVAFFGAGLVLMAFVDEAQGLAAARSAELEAAGADADGPPLTGPAA